MKKYRHDDYDYEEAYNKQIEQLEEKEAERLAKKCKGIGYRTTTTEAGRMIEVDIYPTFGARRDLPRTRKRRESLPKQKNLNDKRAKRHLNQLASCNFGKGDLWGTFTYRNGEEPESIDDAERLFSNFIRRVNRRRKKKGLNNLKYIYVTEWSNDIDKGIRVHHHMIFSGDQDRDELEALWKHGDRTETKRLAPDSNTHITGLIKYITKDIKGEERPKYKRRWRASKGLKKPIVTRSYSKFSRSKVNHMARDYQLLEHELLNKYKNVRFVDADIYTNEVNGGFYIYARMVRD